jgi:hypothetical protein
VEESDTPSKPPPKPRAELRPSPLGNNMPCLTEARPPPPIHSSVVKGPARNITPQQSSIQPAANPPSPILQAGLPPRGFPSGGMGPATKVLLQQGPPADSGKPTLSPFGSCSDRPRFFNTQESVDPQEFMNLVAENIRACHGIEEERQRQEPDNAETCGGDQDAGALLSQETDYGDLDLDAADLMEF